MKIIVTTTPGELMELGLWEYACDVLGFSLYAVNEGMMESDSLVVIEQEQAAEMGLLPIAIRRAQEGSA